MGYKKPRYTQIPNDLLDGEMRDMGLAELRVVLAAFRKIVGFHKQYAPISVSDFMKATGLSRKSVLSGIEKAVERGVLRRHPTRKGTRGEHCYEVNFDDDSGDSDDEISPGSPDLTGVESTPAGS